MFLYYFYPNGNRSSVKFPESFSAMLFASLCDMIDTIFKARLASMCLQNSGSSNTGYSVIQFTSANRIHCSSMRKHVEGHRLVFDLQQTAIIFKVVPNHFHSYSNRLQSFQFYFEPCGILSSYLDVLQLAYFDHAVFRFAVCLLFMARKWPEG